MNSYLTIIMAIITLATGQLDKSYSYGCAGPDKFDCSGLVYYCYLEKADIELSRTAYDQGYNEKYLKIETIEKLEKGDLVFFDTNKKDRDKCDHAGIYIGDNQFIHSSFAKNKVIISNLDEGYYNKNFSWGRRIFN